MPTKSEIQRVGLSLLVKMASDSPSNTSDDTGTSGTSSTPKATTPDPLENQRKQDLHKQQMQFNEDKHELDLEKLKQQLQQSQESFQVKQEQEQVKSQQQQEQQQGQQQEQAMQQQQEQAMQQQQQTMQNQQYQQNIMAKAAAIYTDELEPVSMTSAIPSMATGATLGGGAAHLVAPSTEAQYYRDLAKKITPSQVQKSLEETKKHGPKMWDELELGKTKNRKLRDKLMPLVKDTSVSGSKTRFRAPAHIRKRFLENRALQSNAKRVFGGTGLGLLAGLATHHAMKD